MQDEVDAARLTHFGGEVDFLEGCGVAGGGGGDDVDAGREEAPVLPVFT